MNFSTSPAQLPDQSIRKSSETVLLAISAWHFFSQAAVPEMGSGQAITNLRSA
jgi:hypothetical protein